MSKSWSTPNKGVQQKVLNEYVKDSPGDGQHGLLFAYEHSLLSVASQYVRRKILNVKIE